MLIGLMFEERHLDREYLGYFDSFEDEMYHVEQIFYIRKRSEFLFILSIRNQPTCHRHFSLHLILNLILRFLLANELMQVIDCEIVQQHIPYQMQQD